MAFGDIVKVTPSSKVVGDLALYLISHDMTVEELENLPVDHQVTLPNWRPGQNGGNYAAAGFCCSSPASAAAGSGIFHFQYAAKIIISKAISDTED